MGNSEQDSEWKTIRHSLLTTGCIAVGALPG
jgi:hypothetical protein